MKNINPFKLPAEERVVLFTKFSVPANVLLAAGKALLSLFSLSFFLFVNALYSLGIGLAKFLSLKTHIDVKNAPLSETEIRDRKNRFYALTGWTIAAAAAVYVVYCARLFIFQKESASYGTIIGVTIAAITFSELGMAAAGIKSMRRRHEPMLEAIKMTNLASALVSVVLTQTALLSLSEGNHAVYNGLCGVVFGSLAACVGLFMVVRMKMIANGRYAAIILKRMRKNLARQKLTDKIELLACEDERSLPLHVRALFDEGEGAEAAVEKLGKKYGVKILREAKPARPPSV